MFFGKIGYSRLEGKLQLFALMDWSLVEDCYLQGTNSP